MNCTDVTMDGLLGSRRRCSSSKMAYARIVSTVVCYPLNFLKTRMQVVGEGGKGVRITSIQLARQIFKNEGILTFYSGLSASCVRQATYTGVRMGAYLTLVDHLSENGPPNILVKCICGAVAGAIGGVAGLPPDLALIRMAADGHAPPEKRRNYKNVFNALARISREEGLHALFRGMYPTVFRAVVINISQLLSYGQAKEFLLSRGMQDNAICHVSCSVYSALVATTCVLPPDIAKTRIQNMAISKGAPEYSGMVDAWIKIVKKEGFLALWKGFTPQFARNGPQFVVFFVLFENLNVLYGKYVFKNGSDK